MANTQDTNYRSCAPARGKPGQGVSIRPGHNFRIIVHTLFLAAATTNQARLASEWKHWLLLREGGKRFRLFPSFPSFSLVPILPLDVKILADVHTQSTRSRTQEAWVWTPITLGSQSLS